MAKLRFATDIHPSIFYPFFFTSLIYKIDTDLYSLRHPLMKQQHYIWDKFVFNDHLAWIRHSNGIFRLEIISLCVAFNVGNHKLRPQPSLPVGIQYSSRQRLPSKKRKKSNGLLFPPCTSLNTTTHDALLSYILFIPKSATITVYYLNLQFLLHVQWLPNDT